MKKYVTNPIYGYYEITPKPTEEELRDYYEKKYYQDEHASYAKSYEERELQYFKNKIAQKNFVVQQILGDGSKHLLDVGCGEGFTLDYYNRLGWQVTGVDFSDFGLKQNHPHLTDHLKQGNIFDEIEKLVESGNRYDVVWLDNVLEHVIDPKELVAQYRRLTAINGVLVIEVPNDYSDFQQALIAEGKVGRKYWEAYPDHLSYFSRESLAKLVEAGGFATHKIISDFPIEWYLPNPNSNYVNNKAVGKAAHEGRMFIENFLHKDEESLMNNLIDFYEAMAKIDQGRQLIGFFTK